MAKSIDELIEFILNEIALCGAQGAGSADFRRFTQKFYQEKSPQASGGHDGPAHPPGGLGRKFYETVWDWVREHPDIRIVYKNKPHSLSLTEFETYESQERDPNGVDRTDGLPLTPVPFGPSADPSAREALRKTLREQIFERASSAQKPFEKGNAVEARTTVAPQTDVKKHSFLDGFVRGGPTNVGLAQDPTAATEQITATEQTVITGHRAAAEQTLSTDQAHVQDKHNVQTESATRQHASSTEPTAEEESPATNDAHVQEESNIQGVVDAQGTNKHTDTGMRPWISRRQMRRVRRGDHTNTPVFDEFTTAATAPRMYASQDRAWKAIAGHSVDNVKVPGMQFVLLSIIAAQGPDGILQPDLVRLSGQDKRSVPHRTDLLAQAGYIEKTPVQSTRMRTSLCVHKKYIKEGHFLKRPTTAGEVFRNNTVILSSLVSYLYDILKDIKVLPLRDLRSKLGVTPEEWNTRGIRNAILRLEETGFLERKKALNPHRKSLLVVIRLLRQPQAQDIKNISFRRKKLAAAPSMRNEEDEEAEEDDMMQDLDLDLNSEGDDDEDGHTIDRIDNDYIPPQWSLDRLIPNILFEATDLAGISGIDSSKLRDRTMGKFWRRPLESYICRLTDNWESSQPPHLRHLALIRDTTVTSEKRQVHYIYRTYRNFQKAVDAGDVEWEAVSREAVEKASARSKESAETQRDGSIFTDAEGPADTRQDQSIFHQLGFSRLEMADFQPSTKPSTLAGCHAASCGPRRGGPRLETIPGGGKRGRPKDSDPPEMVAGSPSSKIQKPSKARTTTGSRKSKPPSSQLDSLTSANKPAVKQAPIPLLSAEQRLALNLPPRGRLGIHIENQIREHREKTGNPLSLPDVIYKDDPETAKLKQKERTREGRKPRQKNEPPLFTKAFRKKHGLPLTGKLRYSIVEQYRKKLESEENSRPNSLETPGPAPNGALDDTGHGRLMALEHESDGQTEIPPASSIKDSVESVADKPMIGGTKRRPSEQGVSAKSPKRQRVDNQIPATSSTEATTPNPDVASTVPPQTPHPTKSTDDHAAVTSASKKKSVDLRVQTIIDTFSRRSQPGFYFNPFATRPQPRGRPKKAFLAVFKSSRLKDYQWFKVETLKPRKSIDTRGIPANRGINSQALTPESSRTHKAGPKAHGSDRVAVVSPQDRQTPAPQSGEPSSLPPRNAPSESLSAPPAWVAINSASTLLDQQEKNQHNNPLFVQSGPHPSTVNKGNSGIEAGPDAPVPVPETSAAIGQQDVRTLPVATPSGTGALPDAGTSAVGTIPGAELPDRPTSCMPTTPEVGTSDMGIVPDAGTPDMGILPDAGTPDPGTSANGGDGRDPSSVPATPSVGHGPFSKRGVVLGRGSVWRLRTMIITEILERCNGVFPFNGELMAPFHTLWEQQSGKNVLRPDRTTVSNTVQKMVDGPNGTIQKISFTVPSVNGKATIQRYLIAWKTIPVTDDRIVEMQSNITKTYPKKFYPEPIRDLVRAEPAPRRNPEPEFDPSILITGITPSVQEKLDQRILGAAINRKKQAALQEKRGAENLPSQQGGSALEDGTGQRKRLATLKDNSNSRRRRVAKKAVGLGGERGAALPRASSPSRVQPDLPPINAPTATKDASSDSDTTSSEDEDEVETEFTRHSTASRDRFRNLGVHSFDKYYNSRDSTIRDEDRHDRRMLVPEVQFYPNSGTFSTDFVVRPVVAASGVKVRFVMEEFPRGKKRKVRFDDEDDGNRRKQSRVSEQQTSVLLSNEDSAAGLTADEVAFAEPDSAVADAIEVGAAEVGAAEIPKAVPAKRKSRPSKKKSVNYSLDPTLVERLTGLTGDPNGPIYVAPRKDKRAYRPRASANRSKKVRKPKRIVEVLDSVEKFRELLYTVTIASCFPKAEEEKNGVDDEEDDIDWDIVKKVYGSDPSFDIEYVKDMWWWMQENLPERCQAYRTSFESAYLEAYQRDEVAEVEDRETHDWAGLARWALRNCKYKEPPLPNDPDACRVLSLIESNRGFDRTEWLMKPLAHQVREQRLLRYAYAAPLKTSSAESTLYPGNNPTLPKEDPVLRARSWVRANIATPQPVYNGALAHDKLATLGESTLVRAVTDLVHQKAIRQRKLKRLLPGRNFDFTASFALKYRHHFDQSVFIEAVDFKKHLDVLFADLDPDKRVFRVSQTPNNGEAMALYSLVSDGRVKLIPKLPPITTKAGVEQPRISVFGFVEGNYRHRQISREHFFWNMDVVPNDTYQFGNPLQPSPPPAVEGAGATTIWLPLPEPPLPGKDDDDALLPVWSSIDGQHVVWPWWYRILNLVLQGLMFEPGTTPDIIHGFCRPGTVEVFEVELVLKWLVSAGAARQTGDNTFQALDGFWAAFGDELKEIEDDWFGEHVQRRQISASRQPWRVKYNVPAEGESAAPKDATQEEPRDEEVTVQGSPASGEQGSGQNTGEDSSSRGVLSDEWWYGEQTAEEKATLCEGPVKNFLCWPFKDTPQEVSRWQNGETPVVATEEELARKRAALKAAAEKAPPRKAKSAEKKTARSKASRIKFLAGETSGRKVITARALAKTAATTTEEEPSQEPTAPYYNPVPRSATTPARSRAGSSPIEEPVPEETTDLLSSWQPKTAPNGKAPRKRTARKASKEAGVPYYNPVRNKKAAKAASQAASPPNDSSAGASAAQQGPAQADIGTTMSPPSQEAQQSQAPKDVVMGGMDDGLSDMDAEGEPDDDIF